MILYTTVPYDQIFPTDSSEFSNRMMMHYNGIPVLVEQEEGFSYRIVQLLSSDPEHYLREDCTPGSKISFLPTAPTTVI